ncbi:hypothetical protein PRK78_001025 [Emydomyces testavorans]|uniref:Uncharacterized protein n=1 Tax=Emydomyces testavorans TaxID=2070801 RepID=A0AAF0DCI8_9EURO|nr:hypothetical protein PRK78_001025 [Emydomyces testavorans]
MVGSDGRLSGDRSEVLRRNGWSDGTSRELSNSRSGDGCDGSPEHSEDNVRESHPLGKTLLLSFYPPSDLKTYTV